MVPDPPSRAQGHQARSQVRPWKINNILQGFPGALVHQVFAVLFQTTQDAAQLQNTEHWIEGRSPKSRKMEKFSFM